MYLWLPPATRCGAQLAVQGGSGMHSNKQPLQARHCRGTRAGTHPPLGTASCPAPSCPPTSAAGQAGKRTARRRSRAQEGPAWVDAASLWHVQGCGVPGYVTLASSKWRSRTDTHCRKGWGQWQTERGARGHRRSVRPAALVTAQRHAGAGRGRIQRTAQIVLALACRGLHSVGSSRGKACVHECVPAEGFHSPCWAGQRRHGGPGCSMRQPPQCTRPR